MIPSFAHVVWIPIVLAMAAFLLGVSWLIQHFFLRATEEWIHWTVDHTEPPAPPRTDEAFLEQHRLMASADAYRRAQLEAAWRATGRKVH